jgi:hypothetical protein
MCGCMCQPDKHDFYTAERRSGVDALTAYERTMAFGDDLERIADRTRRG